MLAVLVERHGLGGAGLDLGRPALDLFVPRRRCVGVTSVVQAADQLERQPRTLFSGKPEDLGQHIGRCHGVILADSFEVGHLGDAGRGSRAAGADHHPPRQALLHRIVVAPGPLFSACQRLTNFIRISAGTPWSERIAEGLRTLDRLAARE
jgi:hypothetical protein